MMKKALTLIFILVGLSGFTQNDTIPNGSFETWSNTELYPEIEHFFTSNYGVVFFNTLQPVMRARGVNDRAVRLINRVNPVSSDVLPGLITNDRATGGLSGGDPYSGRPSSVAIRYQCDLAPGDTAFVLLFFLKEDSIINAARINFTGQVLNYREDTFDLPAFTDGPDKLVFYAQSGAVSSTPDGYLLLDELRFDGREQMPNYQFDNFSILNYDEPMGWSNPNFLSVLFNNEQVIDQTDDATEGISAIRVSTQWFYNPFTGIEAITGLTQTTGSEDGRIRAPLDITPHSLEGMIKLESATPDSAIVVVIFYEVDSMTGDLIEHGPFFEFFGSGNEYESFSINTDLDVQPDSFLILLVADYGLILNRPVELGRNLFVDNLFFNYTTSLVDLGYEEKFAFPNPASDRLTVAINSSDPMDELVIIDGLGRVLDGGVTFNQRSQAVEFDVSRLNDGYYYILWSQGNQRSMVKLLKQ